jgi:diguanylate cyclase (GGDEF)-like protein
MSSFLLREQIAKNLKEEIDFGGAGENWRRRHFWRWAAYGAALSLASPAGLWFLLRLAPQDAAERLRWIYAYCAGGAFLAFALFGLAAGLLIDRLRAAATVDPLTGLRNRQYLMDQLPRMREACIRRRCRMAVFFLDVDHFKRINDERGHAAGDRALRAVAEALADQVRMVDLLARYGGEEFVLVCQDMTPDRAAGLAERLRRSVEELNETQLGFPGRQTISIGWTLSPANGQFSLLNMLRLADEGVYRAKGAGRNRAIEVTEENYPVACAKAEEPPADENVSAFAAGSKASAWRLGY